MPEDRTRPATVVPLCRAVRHDDLPGVHCPHCARPARDDGDALLLRLPPPSDDGTLAREL
ncbi:hypothetical protein [Pseudonocardia spirodelae]|uniref:Uncharacterized protein n=1 Tax=Pseudonocardia spirodelae TaxID=3133431 RepID=A0ABU8T8N5_9PSEU